MNIKKIVFATNNQGKIQEMKALLSDLDVEIKSASEVGIIENVVEDRETFYGNALKKAEFVSSRSSEWSVADDTGLCIDVLNGRPGVYSARWAGEGASDEALIEFTLNKLKDYPEEKLTAYFESAVVLCSPDGDHWLFDGQIKGRLIKKPRGKNKPNLPYDLIFIPEGHNKTFAQMSDKDKNSLSHRGVAFKKLKEFIGE